MDARSVWWRGTAVRKVVLELRPDCGDRQSPHSRRDQLDRKRQTVKPTADRGNDPGIPLGEGKPRPRFRRSRHEEPDGFGFPDRRQREGGHPVGMLPRNRQRGPAGGEDLQARAAQKQRLRQRSACIAQVLTVVEQKHELPRLKEVG
jgi:hypothetical protein